MLVADKRKSYMHSNHPSFAPIEEKQLLEGTRANAAFEKMTIHHQRNNLQSIAHCLMPEITSTNLSAIAARPKLVQGASSFFPVRSDAVDHYPSFCHFNQLFDGLLDCIWKKVYEEAH